MSDMTIFVLVAVISCLPSQRIIEKRNLSEDIKRKTNVNIIKQVTEEFTGSSLQC